jgi:hypothetical protein
MISRDNIPKSIVSKQMHVPAMPLKHAMHIGKLGPYLSFKQLYTTQQHMY